MKTNRIFQLLGVISCLLLVSLLLLFGCSPQKNIVLVDGDVSGGARNLTLQDYKMQSVKVEREDKTAKTKGVALLDLLADCGITTENASDVDILFCSEGGNGTAAKIEGKTLESVMLVLNEKKDAVDVYAPKHPRVVGIKSLSAVTVVAKNEVDYGLRVVSHKQTGHQVLPYGRMKLNMFYERNTSATLDGILAEKYFLKAVAPTMADLTGEGKNMVYYKNLHVEPLGDVPLQFANGGLVKKGEKEPIVAVVTGTDVLITDAYQKMKTALDNNHRVLFVLPDGFSYQQYLAFLDELDPRVLGGEATLAATVSPVLSPVALAAMLTGGTPYQTGQINRTQHLLNMDDIFAYAKSIGKTVAYVEGNGTLVKTSEPPHLVPQNIVSGRSDPNTRDKAVELAKNNPDLLFVHFHGIDDGNHSLGPLSDAAKANVLTIEGYIWDVMQTADYDEIILVPDHGHVTYLDGDNNTKGKHDLFEYEDVFVPFYHIKKGA